MISARVRSIIDRFGSMDAFLDWCAATHTDALSAFDITDEEWAALRREVTS